ncbi:MAG: ABC transporter substrate-binding protein [Actinobacteria bacterium]|nr:ABC transporter substrate-binding protein [Actinomycetota bacterium]MBV8960283.1 ABC transporter substrate-binding protein [Actinomycetota bacterium]MBV9255504.1 ABC transporter substrate-binding protein [Actinomycetota bacterium]MBV9664414.1 ABC transporter substrate-binding protein [Actinomycetota bacterium]MBV9933221.1 ABC transporter substrate-binding protein [Actinomycetota bacterium]
MRMYRYVVVSTVALALVAGACGSSKKSSSPSSSTSTKTTLTIGSANFSESTIMAEAYAGALEAKGYKVNRKYNLGAREVYYPAATGGNIDLFPDYAATLLEYVDKGTGLATADAKETVDKLNAQIGSAGLTALEASPAIDANAFAVTKATADKYHLTKLSDLAAVAGQLKLGAPAECAQRPYCALGLKSVYGITFKELLPFKFDSPEVKTALKNGNVDVAELGTTDGTVDQDGFVILQDDKHLQLADNLTPVIRTKALNDEIKTTLNKVSAAMSTSELAALDKRADVDKEDPETVAHSWLKSEGFVKS